MHKQFLAEKYKLVNGLLISTRVFDALGTRTLSSATNVNAAGPVHDIFTVAGVLDGRRGSAGFAIADLVSGVFHWSVDNYGALTPRCSGLSSRHSKDITVSSGIHTHTHRCRKKRERGGAWEWGDAGESAM